MPTTIITTTPITEPITLGTAGMTYALGQNTVVSNVAAPFVVTAGGIVFDGQGYTITISSTANFRGLFNASLAVQNLSIAAAGVTTVSGVNSAARAPGWFFDSRVRNATASNCTNIVSTVTVAVNSSGGHGGIFGGSSVSCVASNCSNRSGTRPAVGGGIFGYASSNCTANNCTSTTPDNAITSAGGAIFGDFAVSCTAINCTSDEGPFFGNYSGGIFGYGSSNGIASNCINKTLINGNAILANAPPAYPSAGIFAGGGGSNTAVNCYNIGNVITTNNGGTNYAIAASTTTAVVSNCYTTNGPIGGTSSNCSSNTNGVWNDLTACAATNNGSGLTGIPFPFPDATTSVQFPSVGPVWYSVRANTPFLLTSSIPPCFVAGARILTPHGYRLVETIYDDDEVQTSDGRAVRVKVYKSHIKCADEDTAPYVISKNSISPGVPDEDLHVSGRHMIRDERGVWQAPSRIMNGSVRQYGLGLPVTYYHIECPNYYTDDLVANGGCIAESFRNRQGECEVSYMYDAALEGFVRVESEVSINSEKLVLN